MKLNQPLRILEEPRVELVQGCCMTLQPGEETTISLRFTMHEMMGGPHEFRVHVPTNDPTQAVILLTTFPIGLNKVELQGGAAQHAPLGCSIKTYASPGWDIINP